MKVVLPVCFLVCALFAGIKTKHVKSKASNLEEMYGPLASLDEKVQNDDVDYLGGDDDLTTNDDRLNVSINAEFRSKPQNFSAKLGETVRLPCEINNADVIVLWLKGDKVIYQGDVSLGTEENFKKNGNYLEVTLTSAEDYGKYSCQMVLSSDNNPVIVHTILPITAPVITSLRTSSGKVVYKPGETLVLTCLASGHPKPKISWHKDNKRLDMDGDTLIIEDLKFKHSGIYRCLADNKVEPPAHYNITINVEHKPIVSVEKYIVNADKEFDVELKCIVHAYPPATVSWKRNDVNIKPNSPKITVDRRQNNVENILIITNLTDSDFGEYYCSASNGIGKDAKAVTLVKTPTLLGKPEKMDKDVVLTWKVESKSPVIEHELQYRKIGENEWHSATPEVSNDEKNVYTVKYALKNFDASDYEIKVRSRNHHGWSEYSDTISVNGAVVKNGSHHKSHNKKHHKEKGSKDRQVVPTPDTPAQNSDSSMPPAATAQEHQVETITVDIPAQYQVNNGSIPPTEDPNANGCTVPGLSMAALSISLLMLFYHNQ